MRKRNRLVFGVGINDANYDIQKENGKLCSYYETWRNMLRRCYSTKFQANNPTYEGCTVCDEWLTFSNFKSWMEQQDWKDKQLDKDLLIYKNKVYSPVTCCFIAKEINVVLTCVGAVTKGNYPFGVYYHKRDRKFYAQCSGEYLGMFNTPFAAHEKWQEYKLKRLEELCKTYYDDYRVVLGLRRCISNLKEDIINRRETISL